MDTHQRGEVVARLRLKLGSTPEPVDVPERRKDGSVSFCSLNFCRKREDSLDVRYQVRRVALEHNVDQERDEVVCSLSRAALRHVSHQT